MEFKGTKGKWELTDRNRGIEVLIKPSTYKSICTTTGNTKWQFDMLLISKAPEMLEMLKDSVEVIRWYMENSTTELHELFFNIGANQIEQTEELIRKATEDQK